MAPSRSLPLQSPSPRTHPLPSLLPDDRSVIPRRVHGENKRQCCRKPVHQSIAVDTRPYRIGEIYSVPYSACNEIFYWSIFGNHWGPWPLLARERVRRIRVYGEYNYSITNPFVFNVVQQSAFPTVLASCRSSIEYSSYNTTPITR